MKGHGGELWHSAGVQVTTTTRNITQVKVQLPGVFYCHFKSGHSPGAPQFQPFINSSPTPRTLWAPQGKAVTLITPPRNSCPFFSHPVQKGSSAQRRKLPGPSPAEELLLPCQVEHPAQSPALPRNPGNLPSIFSTDPCTTALTLSCVAHAPFPWQPASFIQLHYFGCLRLSESLVPKPWLRATLC